MSQIDSYLETERIQLREIQLSDEENLLDLDRDPEVMRYLTQGRASTIKEVRAALGRSRKRLDESGGRYGVWAAIEKHSQKFIGWFHLFPLDEDPVQPEKLYLGYRLKRNFWGQGYATEVSNALLQKAFSEHQASEVFAHAMSENLRSRNVMKKIGMTFRRKLKEKAFPVGFHDAVEYSIQRSGWPH